LRTCEYVGQHPSVHNMKLQRTVQSLACIFNTRTDKFPGDSYVANSLHRHVTFLYDDHKVKVYETGFYRIKTNANERQIDGVQRELRTRVLTLPRYLEIN